MAAASNPTISKSSFTSRTSTVRSSAARAWRSRASPISFSAPDRLRYNGWFQTMLYYLITFLYVLVCLILLMVILLQQGKGGDMASAFGGGSSQTAFGARGGATLLSRLTTAFAV